MDGSTVKLSTDDFVLDTDEILAPTTSNQNHVVFLKVVALSRNISDYLTPVAKPHFNTFTVGTVWLLWLSNKRF